MPISSNTRAAMIPTQLHHPCGKLHPAIPRNVPARHRFSFSSQPQQLQIDSSSCTPAQRARRCHRSARRRKAHKCQAQDGERESSTATEERPGDATAQEALRERNRIADTIAGLDALLGIEENKQVVEEQKKSADVSLTGPCVALAASLPLSRRHMDIVSC